MAEIIPLTVTSCPCGWKVPVNMSVFGLMYPPITLAFDCPNCRRSFEQRIVSSKPSSDKEPGAPT